VVLVSIQRNTEAGLEKKRGGVVRTGRGTPLFLWKKREGRSREKIVVSGLVKRHHLWCSRGKGEKMIRECGEKKGLHGADGFQNGVTVPESASAVGGGTSGKKI